MTEVTGDVAIVGAGFGGSLMALILQRIGLRPILIDRGSHPRFAIGESSTPIANLVLKDLAVKYNLPRLAPLAKYGTARRTYPQLRIGLKRGFSYFKHERHQSFHPQANHANELLVAASSDDERADTHWLRADVDHFFAEEVQSSGIAYLDRTQFTEIHCDVDWHFRGKRDGKPVVVRAKFAIDASGSASVISRACGAVDQSHQLSTRSHAIFGHFANVAPWQDCLQSLGGSVVDHPFPCDHAAVHMLLHDAWMWQLRFAGGVTSAGLVLHQRTHRADMQTAAADQWHHWLRAYPSIEAQFAAAELVAPFDGVRHSGRLQRLYDKMAGTNWAALPNTAGFIDPLHSTGIAQTMCAIRRLAHILERNWKHESLTGQLQQYEQTVREELIFVDRLVDGCYRTMNHFPLFAAYSMLYFVAATTYEQLYVQGRVAPEQAFLCADDVRLRDIVQQVYEQLDQTVAACAFDTMAVDEFQCAVAAAIQPYNIAGLCDPSMNNMYRRTAADG